MKYQNVTDTPGENSYFLVFNLTDTPQTRETVVTLCNNLSGILRSIRNRFPKLEVSCVMGFGAD
ncbi:hypothetical protein K6U71_17485, partial [Vibrio alginolyticus]|nr:hypothetical protein [Vibrio alginolyticus]